MFPPPLLPVEVEFPVPPPAAAAATEDLVKILLCYYYYCMACELTVVKLLAVEAAVDRVVVEDDTTRN